MRTITRNARRYLTPEAIELVTTYVRGCRSESGGFVDRSGREDLYYTAFGLECLDALDEVDAKETTALYLEKFGAAEGLDLVHTVSLLRCWSTLEDRGRSEWIAGKILPRVEEFRTTDGGYGPKRDSSRGTVYDTFLAFLAYAYADAEIPDEAQLVRSIAELRVADGSYSNHPGSASGLTTATAAACVLLTAFDEAVPEATTDWLMERAIESGGFLAAQGTPAPDLLSTGVALVSLTALGVSLNSIRDENLAYVDSLWDESGGFCGSAVDLLPDCEYTWYALLALGCLVGSLDDQP
jgi:prenyltransferase beta subunit